MSVFAELENMLSNEVAKGGSALAPQTLLNSLENKKARLIVSARRLANNLIGLKQLAAAGSVSAGKLLAEGSYLVSRVQWVLAKIDSLKSTAETKVDGLGILPALAIAAGAVVGIVAILDSVNNSINSFNKRAEIELNTKRVDAASEAMKRGLDPSQFLPSSGTNNTLLIVGATALISLLFFMRLKK